MSGILAGIAVVLMGAWTAVGYVSTKGIEMPEYEVVHVAQDYEVREYSGFIRAEVAVEGDYRESLYSGFRKVADYIFGNNTPKASIAMTAPVLQEQSQKIAMTAPVLHERAQDTQQYMVAFIMPKEYTMASLPAPNNPEVRLREIPAKRYAVLRFSGYATERRAARKTAQLVEALEQDGVKIVGAPMAAQYNPPWTPPFMRRNEIQIEVE